MQKAVFSGYISVMPLIENLTSPQNPRRGLCVIVCVNCPLGAVPDLGFGVGGGRAGLF